MMPRIPKPAAVKTLKKWSGKMWLTDGCKPNADGAATGLVRNKYAWAKTAVRVTISPWPGKRRTKR